MSKRRNIKEDMELKKIFITLFFIFFTKSLSAEIVNPNEKLLPYDVVKIQLEALKNNNENEKIAFEKVDLDNYLSEITKDVEVEEEVVGNRLIIHLTVSDDDKGKVIGRNGMIANSIRSLLDIAGKKAGVRVSLSIE